MPKRLWPLAVSLWAAALAGGPGRASAAEPLAQGARLCLHALTLPLSDSEATQRRPLLERLLTDALRAAGFEVVAAAEVEPLVERTREASGGFIDAATGMRDPARYRAYREQLGATLRDAVGCDGQLYAAVVTLRARFARGAASWDGTSQRVSSTGRLWMNALAGVQESGWVAAFSLWLQVTDLEGNDVAFRSAGIETPVQLAVLEDTDYVPEDHWLVDEGRLGDAIRSALGAGGAALRREGRP
jgi:hypothetical protein